MFMKKRIILAVIMASVLVGCGTASNEATISESEELNDEENVAEPKEESVAGEEEKSVEADNENLDLEAPWRKAYIDYLTKDEEMSLCAPEFRYTLIYLDDDDVPELFVDTLVEAGGEFIATYYDGKVVDYQFSRLGSKYIERSGLVYTNTGHMDYYPVTVTKLENGTFTEIGSGISYLSKEDHEKLISGGDYILTYEWEDETVTEEQYNAKIAELYDLDQSKDPDDFKPYEEFLSQLENGK